MENVNTILGRVFRRAALRRRTAGMSPRGRAAAGVPRAGGERGLVVGGWTDRRTDGRLNVQEQALLQCPACSVPLVPPSGSLAAERLLPGSCGSSRAGNAVTARCQHRPPHQELKPALLLPPADPVLNLIAPIIHSRQERKRFTR